MSASLVGSEMCIRDRCRSRCEFKVVFSNSELLNIGVPSSPNSATAEFGVCLLYTSDAADDM
eukprot:5580157-Alexandrium_andersonii.AAC.1